MNKMFDVAYANAYDHVYHEKNYAAECDLIEQLFQANSQTAPRTILDLGCGTGNHAIRLAQRGYKVTGVDRSKQMLGYATAKVDQVSGKGSLEFATADIRTLELGRCFDGAIAMFAVLSYQLTDEDVLAALTSARKHLRSRGLMAFDVWYGPAVLHQRPSDTIKSVRTAEGQILREASGKLVPAQPLCRIETRIRKTIDESLISETEEVHTMRYFFPLELHHFLKSSGFTLLRLGQFPHFDREPDEQSWSVLALSRAT